jgi:RNA polymerase sigma-70 factor (ECF subfamily)
MESNVGDIEDSQTRRGFVTEVERQHGRALRRFLSARLRNASADAADVFQEVFLRLLRMKDHESIRNPQAYLYTVASHVLQQHSMKRSAEPAAGGFEDGAAAVPAETAMDPAEQAELQETIGNFGRALEKLSPRAYATLVMYRCEGMTLEEIGRRLGVSRPMARKYLLRAIAFSDQYFEQQDRL